jgi:hypothetical protein
MHLASAVQCFRRKVGDVKIKLAIFATQFTAQTLEIFASSACTVFPAIVSLLLDPYELTTSARLKHGARSLIKESGKISTEAMPAAVP